MEKCGCDMCIHTHGGRGKKLVDTKGYNVENCPCKNCLVKMVCRLICEDIVNYCETFDKILNEN